MRRPLALRTSTLTRSIAFGCVLLAAACGTVSDFASDGGPRIYGGVAHTGRSLGRHVDLGHPVSATFAILDFPLSFVFDTLLLPVSIAKAAGEVDPKIENDRQIQLACQQLAIALSKGVENSSTKIAVLDFSDASGKADPELRAKLDAALRKALEETGKVGALVPAEMVRKAMADNGITELEEPLVVRSLCQQLEVGAVVLASCSLAELKLSLKTSLRSGADGLEHATATAEVVLLAETK